jgi:phosphoribosylamine--glycine ligase
MNVLLIGSGGREHAIAWKIIQSRSLTQLFIAPGNAGTGNIGINIELTPYNFESIGKFVMTNKIDMVVVGPEEPLVKGIHDFFNEHQLLRDIPVIGPMKAGAMLEGSKEFAKQFMSRYKIPTAQYVSVQLENIEVGINFLKSQQPPYVLKADGLAAGKGVIVTDKLDEAINELNLMLKGKFGKASHTVIIEQYLKGIELSVFILTDSESYKLLPEAKDYKRIGEGDTGPNTGGMGAVSPVPFVDKKFMDKVKKRIIIPTIEGLKKDGVDYKGFIFFGLMNVNGDPYMIEYNVRLGDPESEVVIPRIKTDILELFQAVANRTLKETTFEIIPDTVTTVMLVSGGYPGSYKKGYEIYNLEKVSGSLIFHAGTGYNYGKIVTNGGRVIAVSSFGKNIREAIDKSFINASVIEFQDKYFRKDIGLDLQ